MSRLLPLVLGVAVLGACDSTPAITPPAPALLPLEVGHRWVFVRTVVAASGDTLTVAPDTVAVVSDTTVDGERWFALAGSSVDSQRGFGGYQALREDGVWFRSSVASPPYLQYQAPPEAGMAYPYSPFRYVAEASVVGTSEPAPGGRSGVLYAVRFDSLRVPPNARFRDDVPPLRRLLVPGVGFAEYQTQLWRLDGDGRLALYQTQTWALVRFDPARSRRSSVSPAPATPPR